MCPFFYAMKMYGSVEVDFQGILTSELNGSEWAASHSGQFTHRKEFHVLTA
jgi:hypothetical protein